MLPKNSTTYSQRTSVQAPTTDANSGKFNSKDAAIGMGFTTGMFCIAAINAWIFTRCIPDIMIGQSWSAGRLIGMGLCTILAVVSFFFGFTSAQVAHADWLEYQEFRRAERAAYLAAYKAQGGQVIEQEVRADDFRSDSLGDMILTTYVVWKTRKHTIEELRGPVFVHDSSGRQMRRLGHISKPAAERFGQQLAAIGLIEGREPRIAGRLREDVTLEEAIEMVIDKFDRYSA